MLNKIALIDDDQNILASVSIALEAEGYEVTSYNDGEEGLNGVLANPVDLVILDVKMPRMDGIEVIKKLKEETEIPVIFLTSKDDEIDEVLGLRMGAEDYITKPFSQRLLIERIRVILRRQESIQEQLKNRETYVQSQKIERGFLKLDDERHLCTWRNQVLDLTVTE